MIKKKEKIMTELEVRNLIAEIKLKYKPDFFTFRETGARDGKPNEIEISFGWNIEE